ncbi:rab9 effector protein with kelch motifs isoform X1 [Acipenser oxyrinchus oxyrinchus]|uniref:Rab9 effector protein with kelch motifs n=1 Tax=Acipenser oxyrinchus oxyrinchus TaxID=40147 RepID=A0AAD8CS49_ACIOX|nr:rab9 effector protein with kelch motifs isoform X1 [Acipenser oxyrinchus oxyrinchus]
MGLLQVLEPDQSLQKGTWYALVPRGESPGVRVGHTCTYLPSAADNQGKGKILIVGGANPNGSFSDSHIIDLDTHEWDILEWEGLLPRYEHTSFVPECSPNSLWVFGGAEQSGNRNCIQVLNLDTGIWRSVTVCGTPPSARTYHTCTAFIGDKLYVFGGGDTGAQPVDDAKLHVFDAATLTWSQPDTQGKAPSPRHGHVIVAVGLKLYIHGGLAGDKFYSDLYCINTTDLKWERVKVKGGVPAGCAAHSAVSLGKFIYISGGMDASGALNTMYKYHTEKQRWTLLKFEGLPAKRLDHSMCVIPWADPKASSRQAACGDQEWKDSAQQAADSTEEEKSSSSSRGAPVYLCFVFGGMDTEGGLYNDCIVTLLD